MLILALVVFILGHGHGSFEGLFGAHGNLII
jgi:hypothetical protein